VKRRVILPLLAVGLLAGAGLLLTRYELQGLRQLRLEPRAPGASATSFGDGEKLSRPAPLTRSATTIQLATLYVPNLPVTFSEELPTFQVLGKLMPRFDLIAIQGVPRERWAALEQMVDRSGHSDRQYRVLFSPRAGLAVDPEPLAILFDAGSVEVDPSATYLVDDPDGLMRHDPMVASFAVRGPEAQERFTFTVVNVLIEQRDVAAETPLLDDVWRAVRQDARGEDDVLLVGRFAAGIDDLPELQSMQQIVWANPDLPTNTRGTRMLDNILFSRIATLEATGRTGVIDVMREFDLSLSEAAKALEALPVWAEFSIREGALSSPIAAEPSDRVPR